jgi:hypothetical protein
VKNYHFGMICGKSTFGRKNSNTPADVEKFNLKIMTHKLTNDQIENRVWSELVIKYNLQIVFKWHFIYYLSTFNDRILKFCCAIHQTQTVDEHKI